MHMSAILEVYQWFAGYHPSSNQARNTIIMQEVRMHLFYNLHMHRDTTIKHAHYHC